jgi:2-polyprenyl-3-methyl-5-hydroxy-6-metoxy-1,4-benzoquinol methylase
MPPRFPVANRPLEDLDTRLQSERDEAERAYNDALIALGRAIDGSAVPAAHGTVANGAPGARPRFARLRRFLRWLIGAAPNDAAIQWLQVVRQQAESRARVESRLVQYLQTIAPYVDAKDRASGGADLLEQVLLAQQRIAALRREVERLSAVNGREETAHRFARPEGPARLDSALDDAEYVGFEHRFRGSEAVISRRLHDYLPLFASCTNVLDVGCGRGELLDLFRTQGVVARGIDANASMVARCRDRGLDVEQADAIAYLERQPDGSLGGLTAIQVVEHFQPADLLRFLRLAHDTLRPGAPMLLETINVACWAAFFDSYVSDLTHARPLHPATLEYYVRACGFSNVDVQFREPVEEQLRLDRIRAESAGVVDPAVARVVAAVNANADKLNERLFSYRDYAVIARR